MKPTRKPEVKHSIKKRYCHKKQEDLKKASWYLNEQIRLLELENDQ